jgi:hypothetical protein
MPWNVEYTDEFGKWWQTLSEGEQEDAAATVALLEARGPQLPFPYSSGVEPLRILYAFDPRRTAILLIGGNKTGDERFYERMIPRANKLYDEHLDELHREGLIPKE